MRGHVISRELGLALVLAALAVPSLAPAQVTFEGRITDPNGTPIADADLDFFETQTGQKVDPSAPGFETQSDKTDAFGFFSMVIVPDIYDVRFEPPLARDELAPIFVRELVLGADLERDVTLPVGSRLTGRVLNFDGQPLGLVDLDLRDPNTGERIATARDDTDANGVYGISALPGVWDVVFSPPDGASAAPLVVDSIDLTGPAVLDVTLPRGRLVTGRVIRASDSLPVRYTDIDFEEPGTNRRLPANGDQAGLDGRFTATVREGMTHIFVIPATGFPLAPTAFWDVDVTGDVDLGDIVLQDGFIVSGTVRDPGGAPVADADLDAFLPGECRRFPLADGVADANGQFSFRVEPVTWDFVANPPPGVTLPTTRFGSVDVSGDLARDFQLQTDPAPFEVSSVVEDPDGLPVAGAIVRGVPASGAASWEVTTDAAGEFTALAPPGRHRLEITPPSGSGLGVRILEGVDLPCALGPALALLPFVDPNPPAAPAPLRAAPNPWRETTTLQLDVPAAVASARVTVYDVSGRRVREVYRGALEAGEGREILWDGRDDAGRPTATGVYFVRAELGRTTTTAKTVRLRP